jgi:hypothetical protein
VANLPLLQLFNRTAAAALRETDHRTAATALLRKLIHRTTVRGESIDAHHVAGARLMRLTTGQ